MNVSMRNVALVARRGVMTSVTIAAAGAWGWGCGGSPASPSEAPTTMTPDAAAPQPAMGDAGLSGTTYDDAVGSSEPNAAYSVTLTTQPFTVPAGSEVYKCQDFANPFRGQAADIIRYDLTMNPGSHHMLLFYKQGATDGAVHDCSGLMVDPFTFGAQQPSVSESYPEGIGAAIPAGTGFTVNMHYLNTDTKDITGVVKVTMFVARPGVVVNHAGVFQFVQTQFSIPSDGQPHTISASCNIPQNVNILSTSSHMHQRAQQFVATSGSTMLYETNAWSDPKAQVYSPPLQLSANSTVDWSCTYVNDTGAPLKFGESALTNAMCNFNATYYPVADPSNPVVTCLR
jgi:hypothetical protein